MTLADLNRRWDDQQTLYIEQRERRFDVMFELLGQISPDGHPTVLDLASGPGAISARLLDRFPGARSVAVDVTAAAAAGGGRPRRPRRPVALGAIGPARPALAVRPR